MKASAVVANHLPMGVLLEEEFDSFGANNSRSSPLIQPTGTEAMTPEVLVADAKRAEPTLLKLIGELIVEANLDRDKQVISQPLLTKGIVKGLASDEYDGEVRRVCNVISTKIVADTEVRRSQPRRTNSVPESRSVDFPTKQLYSDEQRSDESTTLEPKRFDTLTLTPRFAPRCFSFGLS